VEGEQGQPGSVGGQSQGPRLHPQAARLGAGGLIDAFGVGLVEEAGIRGGNAQTTLNGSSVQLGGDVITKIDGKTVGSMDDVISAIADKKPGDSVSIEYLRNKTSKTATITLTQRPATVPQQ